MASLNVYEMVTERIIKQLKQGTIPWQKPWTGVRSGAFNRVSKKPYSLINQAILEKSGEYATFHQWKNLGGHIKKGAKSEIVVFWKIIDVEEKNDKGEIEKKKLPLLRYYNVFHISQVEGVEPLKEKLNTEIEPIEEADRIIKNYVDREHITFKECISDKAFYRPMTDTVVVPLKEQYKNINSFYQVAFHEITHSTGAQKRLDRDIKELAPFGSEIYSKEELVAELGSAFLINHLGIETKGTFQNSASYIESWLQVLRNDNKLIVSASSKAEKAVNYILGIE